MILDSAKNIYGRIGFVNEQITIDQSVVDEFKQFARIDNSFENSIISNILLGSIQACEKYLGRALFEKRISYSINKLCEEIELPYPPLRSVESLSIRQEDGTLSEIPSTNYYVVKERIPGSVVLKESVADVSLSAKTSIDPFVIEYICGYGEWCDIPDAIRHAIFVWANDGYQNRVIQPEPPIEVSTLLSLYTIVRI